MRQAVRTLGIQGQPPRPLTPGWGPGRRQLTAGPHIWAAAAPQSPAPTRGPSSPGICALALGSLGSGRQGLSGRLRWVASARMPILQMRQRAHRPCLRPPPFNAGACVKGLLDSESCSAASPLCLTLTMQQSTLAGTFCPAHRARMLVLNIDAKGKALMV